MRMPGPPALHLMADTSGITWTVKGHTQADTPVLAHTLQRVTRAAAHSALGERPRVQVSLASDSYDNDCNYAGIIIYSHGGKFKWYDEKTCIRGRRNRAFYVLIENTDDWDSNDLQAAGKGMVHDKVYKDVFGPNTSHNDGVTCCGGFSVMSGVLKCSSMWLNMKNGSVRGCQWSSDGHKCLSESEKLLAGLAVNAWQKQGPGIAITLSDDVHDRLWAAS
eukprot:365707-Chlamydomonas_euryale.AAC.3